MSGHFLLPFFSLFGSFFAVGGALSQRYPRLLRPLGMTGGLFLVAMGIALPQFFHGLTAPALFRCVIIASGALLTLGAALNWLPTTEDDAPMRPATGRPLRHFGDTP